MGTGSCPEGSEGSSRATDPTVGMRCAAPLLASALVNSLLDGHVPRPDSAHMKRKTNAVALASSALAMATRGVTIATYLKSVSPWRFRQFIRQVELALACLRDVASGRYRLPWKTVAALTTALAYFLMPVDLVPDFIPFSGFIDDAAVFAMVFGAAEADLRRYCDWKGLDPKEYFEVVANAARRGAALTRPRGGAGRQARAGA